MRMEFNLEQAISTRSGRRSRRRSPSGSTCEWRLTDAGRPKRMARARLPRGPLPGRPAVAPPPRRARRRDPARDLQPPRPRGRRRGLRHPLPPRAREPRSRARAARAARGHVDLVVLARYMQILSRRLPRGARRPGDQHPPLVPAGLRGRGPLPAGVRARREDHRRHRPLRHRGARRRADHRAGRRPRHATASTPRRWSGSAATSSARCSPAPSSGTSRTACSCTATAPSSSSRRPRASQRAQQPPRAAADTRQLDQVVGERRARGGAARAARSRSGARAASTTRRRRRRRAALLEVLLPQPQPGGAGERRVAGDDVDLGVVEQRVLVEVGRADRQPLVVDDADLGVHVERAGALAASATGSSRRGSACGRRRRRPGARASRACRPGRCWPCAAAARRRGSRRTAGCAAWSRGC